MAIKKNTNDLISQAATTLADNSTQDISPQDVREMAENNAFSSYNKITDNNLVGLKNYSTAATYEAAQGVVYNGSIYISNTIPTPGAFNASEWDILSGGEVNTSSNSGAGEGLALAKSGSNLPFKSITAGTGITLTSAANELQISSAGGVSIYTADGTFTGNRTANLNNNNVLFDHGTLKVNGYQTGSNTIFNAIEIVNNIDGFQYGIKNNGNVGIKSGFTTSIESGSGFNAILHRPQNGTFYGVRQTLALNNSAGAVTEYGSIETTIASSTAGSENGKLRLYATRNGTETIKISIEDDITINNDTLIKGSDNASGTSGLKVTDINNNSLLDVRNNGQTSWGGSTLNNVAHVMYNPSNQSTSLLRLMENNGNVGINLSTAGRIETNVAGQSLFKTYYIAGVPHIELWKYNGSGSPTQIVDIQSGDSYINSPGITLGGQTGKTGAKVSIMQASAISSQQLFFGNITTNTAGRLGSSGSFGTDQKGLECFDTDINKKFVWNGSAWEKIKGNIESVTQATATTLTPNIDTSTMEILSSLAAALTIAAPTGTPHEGQGLTFRFKDDGTARALTWNAIFEDYTGSLPTTTTAGKTVYIGCKYNLINTKWDVIAVQTQP